MNKDFQVDECLGYSISLLARSIEQEFEGRLKEFGMTRSSFAVLHAASDLSECTPAEIAVRLKIDRAAVTRHLDRLEEKKIIKQ